MNQTSVNDQDEQLTSNHEIIDNNYEYNLTSLKQSNQQLYQSKLRLNSNFEKNEEQIEKQEKTKQAWIMSKITDDKSKIIKQKNPSYLNYLQVQQLLKFQNLNKIQIKCRNKNVNKNNKIQKENIFQKLAQEIIDDNKNVQNTNFLQQNIKQLNCDEQSSNNLKDYEKPLNYHLRLNEVQYIYRKDSKKRGFQYTETQENQMIKKIKSNPKIKEVTNQQDNLFQIDEKSNIYANQSIVNNNMKSVLDYKNHLQELSCSSLSQLSDGSNDHISFDKKTFQLIKVIQNYKNSNDQKKQ